MATLHHIFLLFALLLLTQLSESRLTQESFKNVFNTSKTNDEEGTMWAVLVAGSSGYGNYRHQADICHAYQILKRGGLKDENIIVFMYDDIAFHQENPRQGSIINHPDGEDVYQGVPKDYTGENLTKSNLIAAILGDESAGGKVVKSGPNDRIFIYYSDHGGPGLLSMPNGDDIFAQDFMNTLQKKAGSYSTMVIYVEACEAGSIFNGLLPNNMNIYVVTASNPTENSYAIYCSSELNTCLGDLFSVSWMEDSDMQGTLSETLEQQYEVVKQRTGAEGDEGSHVMQYGDTDLTTSTLSVYLGSSSPNSYYLNYRSNSAHLNSTFSIPIEQHEADIFYLKQKVLKAPEGSKKKKEAQTELEAALSHREHIDYTFEEIGKALFGHGTNVNEISKTVRSPGQPIVDDWDCFKNLAGIYKTHCGSLSTYGKKHMRAFANMCNVGVQQVKFAKVTSQVCGNKFN